MTGAAAGFAASAFGAGAGAGGGRTRGVNGSNDGVDRDRLAFLDLDFLQDAGRRRGNFRVHFVGGDFEERFVALDFIAGLFKPLGDGSFEDAFAHLGHDYIGCHGVSPLKKLHSATRDIVLKTRMAA
jgi:hypothetical protein